ncbi:hypothetical protein [Achromobacter sp. 2789STDY5608633]|uniref:hypothetical protein n=1 Tax=Achromobacter sp. 2789STDY5608633 TaxID=1806501 RepID=UPI0012E29488|nr:hypothetical protein [Achromobacter sp. 2789STDY5608633]
MDASPFSKYRSLVLGHYSTASWLRRAVLAMYNGQDYKVGLSQLTGVDDQHFEALKQMLTHYRLHGENDPAFIGLVTDIQARVREENLAQAREEALVAWLRLVKAKFRASCDSAAHVIDDHYNWLEGQFDKKLTPDQVIQPLISKCMASIDAAPRVHD